MQVSYPPIAQDLVLIGGGHSHAIVLKQLGMHPLRGVQMTLIADVVHTPYSGMLPGYVAGLYRFDDCHIDLQPLCQFAGVRLIRSRAIGLDLVQNRVLLADRPAIAFDLLSIDIGSTPAALSVPGAAQYAIPVKPISQFLQYWQQVVQQVTDAPERSVRIGVVGGGAGGVELALAIQGRLQRVYQAAHQPPTQLELHLFQRGDRLVPERPPWVGKRLQQILCDRGAQIYLQEEVCAITADESTSRLGASSRIIHCTSGLAIPCDYVFWVTQASAAPWLRQSGLATDAQGFVQITDTLQSVSHPQVFAAGDVATIVNHPRPKAGVFAVRQGKPLYENLRRRLLGQIPKTFVPQQEFLILIGTGDRSALASRAGFGFGPHPLIWQWKDRIDRQFMAKFSDLPPMAMAPDRTPPPVTPGKADRASPSASPTMHCAGCGSKVGSSVLEKALYRVQQAQPLPDDRDDILIGLDAPDDAAVVTLPPGQVMVQTIDHFRALLDDPFIFGQICTNHCLSDLFAMGASPRSALAIATLPYATATKLEEMLYQLLSGAVTMLHQAHAVLIGGHTTEGNDLSLGLACNGIAYPDRLWRKQGMAPGQVLILTKAIGTGTLFAADMQLQAKGRWIEQAIESMVQSNQMAAECLRSYSVAACTDVTGFGVLGHLMEMVNASHVSVELDLNALPILAGAKETIQHGIYSSIHAENLQATRVIQDLTIARRHPLYPLLFDPQTSGGLLAAVPADQSNACLSALHRLGYSHSRLIGFVIEKTASPSIKIQV